MDKRASTRLNAHVLHKVLHIVFNLFKESIMSSKGRPLSPIQVLQAISNTSPAMRAKLRRWLYSGIADRHGSEEWARLHPESTPVDDEQRLLMLEAHKNEGVSFRALEGIFHLIANSGNDAQRCVQSAERILTARQKSKSAGDIVAKNPGKRSKAS